MRGISATFAHAAPWRGLWRVGALIVLLATWSLVAVAQQAPSAAIAPHLVSASEAYEATKSGKTILIDTRESYEKRSGSPAGVGGEITYWMSGAHDADFVHAVSVLMHGRTDQSVTLICQAGVRSAAAARVLARSGFTHVQTVAGGYDAWRDEQVPSQGAR